jgi:hypothetical protein
MYTAAIRALHYLVDCEDYVGIQIGVVDLEDELATAPAQREEDAAIVARDDRTNPGRALLQHLSIAAIAAHPGRRRSSGGAARVRAPAAFDRIYRRAPPQARLGTPARDPLAT